MRDVAISWYNPPKCTAETDMVPGDSHGPNGPRNDRKFAIFCRGGAVPRPQTNGISGLPAAMRFCAQNRWEGQCPSPTGRQGDGKRKAPCLSTWGVLHCLDYLAYSTALVSRMTLTLIWPGYSSSASIFLAMSRARRIMLSSVTTSGLTMMRTSRPAWMA